MGVNSLPKTVTRQRRGCDLNPGHSAPGSSTLTTRLPSHPAGQLAGVFNVAKFLPDVVVDDFVVRRHIFDELKELLPQLVRFHLDTDISHASQFLLRVYYSITMLSQRFDINSLMKTIQISTSYM